MQILISDASHDFVCEPFYTSTMIALVKRSRISSYIQLMNKSEGRCKVSSLSDLYALCDRVPARLGMASQPTCSFPKTACPLTICKTIFLYSRALVISRCYQEDSLGLLCQALSVPCYPVYDHLPPRTTQMISYARTHRSCRSIAPSNSISRRRLADRLGFRQ